MKFKIPSAAKPDLHSGASARFDLSPKVLDLWNPGLRGAVEEENEIGIFDVIGEDYWSGEGVTAKRISAALRKIGAETDVTVRINSPGGDVFEGLAIYNLLKEHKGHVTVKVLGLAASMASVIAMAADEIKIARAGFFMIHNCWGLAIGNRHDLRATADFMEPIDTAMAEVYSSRTGLDQDSLQDQMDAETWINGSAAVDQGFADSLLDSDEIKDDPSARGQSIAAKKLDVALAKSGMSRAERRKLLSELKSSTPSAGDDGTPSATGNGTLSAAEYDLAPLPEISFPC